jgi:LPS export ABC transporter protein LptC
MRAQNRRRKCAIGLLAACALLALGAESGESRFTSQLRVEGMTFVGSRGTANELVLRAQHADFHPETNLAVLSDVHATALDVRDKRTFDVFCERGELDVETNDFLAEGNVHGSTGEGQRYRTAWVRYDHDRGVLYTDAPVSMEDDSGSFRGDGFRYDTRKRSFRLLGNVSVVQKP